MRRLRQEMVLEVVVESELVLWARVNISTQVPTHPTKPLL